MDFGLAQKEFGSAPMTTALSKRNEFDTRGHHRRYFQYMAPEPIEEKGMMRARISSRWRELVYEMATGKRAVTGKEPRELIADLFFILNHRPMASVSGR